jgi:hypothetical protein
LLPLLLSAIAFANPTFEWGSQEDPDRAPEAATPHQTAPNPALHSAEAEDLPVLTRGQHRWLKPRRERLPPNPRAYSDFTAYTLEHGEVRIGLTSIRFGLIPRVQVGTEPLLDVLGFYNVHLKWNTIRLGPFDLAGVGSYYFPQAQEGFAARYLTAGGQASIRFTPGWSVHATGRYHRGRTQGVPDPVPVLSFVTQVTGTQFDLDGIQASLADMEQPWAEGEAVYLEVATDLHFNRRDTLVLRFGFFGWADVAGDFGDVPTPFGLPEEFAHTGPVPVADGYVASLSYRMSFKQLQIGMGVGKSAFPWMWAPQALDLSYTMGGKTNRRDSRTRTGWRKNRKIVKKGEILEHGARSD